MAADIEDDSERFDGCSANCSMFKSVEPVEISASSNEAGQFPLMVEKLSSVIINHIYDSDVGA